MSLKIGDILIAKIDYKDDSNRFIKGRQYVINSIDDDHTVYLSIVSDDPKELLECDNRDFFTYDDNHEYYLWNYVYTREEGKRKRAKRIINEFRKR